MQNSLRSTLSVSLLIALGTAACTTSTVQDKPAPAPASPTPAVAPVAAASAAAPTELKIIDRQVGTGKEAQVGKAAMIQYTGWLYDEKAPDNKGKEFDSSSKREGLPFGFIIGVGRVIKGWDQGVIGMKVGGKRTLIIPPALGYADKNIGNGLIPPNSTLLFDLELVEIKP